MYGYDPIQIVAMLFAGLAASVVVLALFRAARKSASSRQRQNRLSNAFERASYVRTHGSVPVGSQYGIYEDWVCSVGSMR